MSFGSCSEIREGFRDMVRAPRRVPVSQAAQEFIRVEMAGGSGPWGPDVTPYMVDPMNCMTSRLYDSVVFVGPARTGKTQSLVCGLLAHSIKCDPVGDMLAVFPTEENERKFGKTDLRKFHRYSPDIELMLSSRSHDTGITSVIYRNGMALFLGHPSSAQLAQTTYRRVVLSDYDSMPSSVGDEGEPFGLAMKRTETFMSSGITVAESSPKRFITDPRWVQQSPHEAPPTDGGILPLYNMGDRRRWYWKCLHCGERFEAPPLPTFDDGADVTRASESAHVPCPHCGGIHRPSDRRRLNLGGQWQMEPGRDRNRIASFWLKGCAAGFQTWESLAANYLRARQRFEATGDEELLKKSHNTDQGVPYRPKTAGVLRSADSLRERAEDLDRRVVPDAARFLLTAVDVQAHRFVVSVAAVGVGSELWLIDRFDVDVAERRNADGGATAIDPSAFLEDWQYMHRRTLGVTFLRADGAEFSPYRLAVDSGGKSGVTSMAYRHWLWARAQGHGQRVMLTKGRDADSMVPRVKETRPDSQRKDRKAKARGEVPVYLMNSTLLKDDADGALRIERPGPRYVHIPRWMPSNVLDEFTAESRGLKRWEKVTFGAPNESWDLLVMHLAQLVHLGVDKWGQNWERAPAFAQARERGAPLEIVRRPQPVKRSSGFGRDDWVL